MVTVEVVALSAGIGPIAEMVVVAALAAAAVILKELELKMAETPVALVVALSV